MRVGDGGEAGVDAMVEEGRLHCCCEGELGSAIKRERFGGELARVVVLKQRFAIKEEVVQSEMKRKRKK